MTKLYAESSSQTVLIDPDHHVRNYKHRCPSNIGIQTEECNIESFTPHNEIIENGNIMPLHAPLSESLDPAHELHRRLHPTRSDDFATLQSEMLQWRCREERKITLTARNAAHKREMIKLLLRKESHLLRKIDHLRNSATDKWKTEQIELMMEMMSKPKQWEDSNGSIIRVDTPEICRARIMKSMYDGLIEKVDNGEDIEAHMHRISLLLLS
jgi:hypothetical protein